jgi:hypothetical protein
VRISEGVLLAAPEMSRTETARNLGFCARLAHLLRGFTLDGHERPVVEVEQDVGQVLAIFALECADLAPSFVATSRSRMAPTPGAGVSAVSSTSDQARTVSPAKQGLAWEPALIATMHCALAKPVEAERAGHRHDVAAIDQALAILARGGVEMRLGRVLPQPRGHHVLGFLDGHAVHVVDDLAHA